MTRRCDGRRRSTWSPSPRARRPRRARYDEVTSATLKVEASTTVGPPPSSPTSRAGSRRRSACSRAAHSDGTRRPPRCRAAARGVDGARGAHASSPAAAGAWPGRARASPAGSHPRSPRSAPRQLVCDEAPRRGRRRAAHATAAAATSGRAGQRAPREPVPSGGRPAPPAARPRRFRPARGARRPRSRRRGAPRAGVKPSAWQVGDHRVVRGRRACRAGTARARGRSSSSELVLAAPASASPPRASAPSGRRSGGAGGAARRDRAAHETRARCRGRRARSPARAAAG